MSKLIKHFIFHFIIIITGNLASSMVLNNNDTIAKYSVQIKKSEKYHIQRGMYYKQISSFVFFYSIAFNSDLKN